MSHVYSVTVWRLSETGSKLWPENRFETTDPSEIPTLQARARNIYAQQLRAGTHCIDVEHYNIQKGTIKLN